MFKVQSFIVALFGIFRVNNEYNKVISAHLRHGSQVELLFVPPFQRLIILHEHAVYIGII